MNPENTFPASNASPCGECAAGVMHLRHITYFTWLGEELITVPKSEINTLIPQLKARGATDIIELPLSKIVP